MRLDTRCLGVPSRLWCWHGVCGGHVDAAAIAVAAGCERGIHGGGLRVARSRAERFDAAVLEALEPIEHRWHEQLTQLDVAVDDVPEVVQTSTEDLHWGEDVVQDGSVPLARLVPAGVDRTGQPTRARIVLYRRPLEARPLLHDGQDDPRALGADRAGEPVPPDHQALLI